jgi:4-carboxymuconolactone decarboxylase
MNAQNGTILNAQQQGLIKIASYTATGSDLLKAELDSSLNAGLTINEIKEALVQLYAYCGFPRSLNALNTFNVVLDDRKAKGIKDVEGKKVVVENKVSDKYEQGRKVLEELTKTPQRKPAPGFGEFAPRIDAFLKEHLFADIFASDVLTYQQREFVTIAALASMTGVEAQLQSHINIGKNTGIMESQLVELADLIEKTTNITQANSVRKILNKPLAPVVSSNMMVRMAEIVINPEYLEEYKNILRENAAISVKTEAGVLSIFPMYQLENPTQMRIVEIYADKDAYQSHLQTPHFLHYKTTTLKMVKSLKLVEMSTIDKEMMRYIFEKIK